jgi:hypothetical protein
LPGTVEPVAYHKIVFMKVLFGILGSLFGLPGKIDKNLTK